MAEIWGAAAITVGGGIISGLASSGSAKKQAKYQDKLSANSDYRAAAYQGLLSQFEAEQDYYYTQLQRSNKERGLSEFRKFNTVDDYASGYSQDSNTGVSVGEKPVSAVSKISTSI